MQIKILLINLLLLIILFKCQTCLTIVRFMAKILHYKKLTIHPLY